MSDSQDKITTAEEKAAEWMRPISAKIWEKRQVIVNSLEFTGGEAYEAKLLMIDRIDRALVALSGLYTVPGRSSVHGQESEAL